MQPFAFLSLNILHHPHYNKSGKKYNDMVAADCSKVDPALLPPSPSAAFHHGLQVYHQIQIWKQLSDVEKDPVR